MQVNTERDTLRHFGLCLAISPSQKVINADETWRNRLTAVPLALSLAVVIVPSPNHQTIVVLLVSSCPILNGE